MNIFLASPDETEALGSRLVLEPSAPWKTLALHGELGAGKTTLVRGLVRAMGGDPDEVHSPSYVLEHH
ncbi:MAG: tRNA (adenosine(37)-N6)-threonylcarbamoyltransferase complex ATPase subunit type 1 TsaE, partial [Planctomycetota bacterium]